MMTILMRKENLCIRYMITSLAKLRILTPGKNKRNGNEDERETEEENRYAIALVRSCNYVAAE